MRPILIFLILLFVSSSAVAQSATVTPFPTPTPMPVNPSTPFLNMPPMPTLVAQMSIETVSRWNTYVAPSWEMISAVVLLTLVMGALFSVVGVMLAGGGIGSGGGDDE